MHQQNTNQKKSKSPNVLSLALVSISLIFFYFILVYRQPILFRPFAINMRFGFSAAAMFVFLGFLIVNFLNQKIRFKLILLFCLAIAALAIAGTWAATKSTGVTFNGLIQVQDSQNYYLDALRLLNGVEMSSVHARRPLISGLIASVLYFGNLNIMFAQAVLALIFGFSLSFSLISIKIVLGLLG